MGTVDFTEILYHSEWQACKSLHMQEGSSAWYDNVWVTTTHSASLRELIKMRACFIFGRIIRRLSTPDLLL